MSLQLGHSIRSQHRADLGNAYVPRPGDAVTAHFVEDLGRMGRKSGGGFYDYPKDDKKRLWPGLGREYPTRTNSRTWKR